jgi:hypothetical protein
MTKEVPLLWRAIRLISLLIVNIILYVPVITIEDPMGQAYYFVLYGFLVMVICSIVLLIEYRGPAKKPKLWVILILTTIVIAYAPHKVYHGYLDVKEWNRYGKPITAQELQNSFYSQPAGMVPSMKYVHVEVLDGHISLHMEFDPTAFPKDKYNPNEFKEDVSHHIASDALNLARYRRLETISAEVIYSENISYSLQPISLRGKKELGEMIDYVKERLLMVESK